MTIVGAPACGTAVQRVTAGTAVRPSVRPLGSGDEQPSVRPLGSGDDDAVRQLFRDTVCLGRPLPFELPDWDAYESLCLDWYLGAGRHDAGVLVDEAGIAGYTLVCTDTGGYQKWQRRRAAAFSVVAARRIVSRRGSSEASRFLRLRLKDGWVMWRRGVEPPLPAHAHLNLAPRWRAARLGHLLGDHIDERCRVAGLPGWFGEINARSGHRSHALERLGGVVVHRDRNHTLSWLMGQPVERLTVARWLPDPALVEASVRGSHEGTDYRGLARSRAPRAFVSSRSDVGQAEAADVA